MVTARLTSRGFFSRRLAVRVGDREHEVRYSPWGLDTEHVLVDGRPVARRTGPTMTFAFDFALPGGVAARLAVVIPPWADVLPIGGFRRVRLEIDGRVVYEEPAPPPAPRPRRHAFDF